MLRDERETIHVELESLKLTFINIKRVLEKNIETWERYEMMSESILSWLKQAENKVRAETSVLLSPHEIENKIIEMTELCSSFQNNKVEIGQLITFSKEIINVS